MNMLRRLVLLASISAVLLLLAMQVAGAAEKPYAGQTLTVSAWSGQYVEDYREAVVKPFEEWSGAKVDIVPGWSELVTRIIAAPEDNPPYDVLLGEALIYMQARENDLILPLRWENIPNAKGGLKKDMAYRLTLESWQLPTTSWYLTLHLLPTKIFCALRRWVI